MIPFHAQRQEQSDRALYKCCHCGGEESFVKFKFCAFCKTAIQRKEMDQSNNDLFMQEYGHPYVCNGQHER